MRTLNDTHCNKKKITNHTIYHFLTGTRNEPDNLQLLTVQRHVRPGVGRGPAEAPAHAAAAAAAPVQQQAGQALVRPRRQ